MEISNARAALVQFAFYGGYATMAIPAALFMRKHTYKKGILLGLLLSMLGTFLFIPAVRSEQFFFFLVALYILTFGLAFLETTANPYILSMGSPETATSRLNLAQAFNPIGSLLGMFAASEFVLSRMLSETKDGNGNSIYQTFSDTEKAQVRTHDLQLIGSPYIILGFIILLIFLIIFLTRMPTTRTHSEKSQSPSRCILQLMKNKRYKEGVITQMFYVAAQIMCWTFIIQYAENLGLSKATAQHYNIVAMVLFLIGRFLNTLLLRYFKSSSLLEFFGVLGAILLVGTINFENIYGLYCLVATSACMSLMFPTIYSISLKGLSQEDAKMGSAGLVMAIVGGALLPPLQGWIIDADTIASFSAVNFSFALPMLCLILVAYYGYRVKFVHKLNL